MFETYYHEGYLQCICGQWAVGMHSECRALLTEDEYRRWGEGQERRMGVKS